MKWNKYTRYLLVDDPIPYHSSLLKPENRNDKNNILIYPITMKKYIDFHIFASCLLLDKNTSGKNTEDMMKIISMTYLEYLYYISNSETPYIMFFTELLKMCTRNNNIKVKYGYNNDKRGIFTIDDISYCSADFDEIKNIICEQNMLELPDESIQKEIRDKMKEAEELRSRINNHKMASLEEQLACVIVSSGLTLNDIYDMPIRKFAFVLQRADLKLHYQIYLSASMSGFVEFKDKSVIKHWMSEIIKDKFGNTMSVGELEQKLPSNAPGIKWA